MWGRPLFSNTYRLQRLSSMHAVSPSATEEMKGKKGKEEVSLKAAANTAVLSACTLSPVVKRSLTPPPHKMKRCIVRGEKNG